MLPSLPSPLAQRTLLAAEPIAASIKASPEDFLVDELPLFDPCGEGEHLYVGVQKRGLSHHEMVAKVSRHFGVPSHSIGTAGMKDRQAVTHQTVSVHLCNRQPPAAEIPGDDIGILWMARHRHRLRRGQLAGNRFSIRIREIDPLRAPTLWQRLRRLEECGLPDALGPQRFGSFGTNHILGWCLLHGLADQCVATMLGDAMPNPTPRMERVLEHLHAQRFREAAAELTRHQGAERRILLAMARGMPAAAALRAAGAQTLEFFVTGIQSAVFNRVLDLRLEAGTLNAALEGDILWRPGAHGRFHFDETRAADPEQRLDIAGRIASGQLSPSGPMFGREMDQPAGEAARMEREAMAAFRLDDDAWRTSQFAPTGARRPLRVPVRNAQLEAGTDERGPFIRLAFDLPAGAFATTLLHEVLGAEPRDASRRSGPVQSSSEPPGSSHASDPSESSEPDASDASSSSSSEA